MIDPVNYFLASLYPFIPVPPDEGSGVSFGFQKLDPVMEFAHPLGNLLRCFGNAEVACGQRTGIEVFLEPSIDEGAEEAGTDPLTG